MPSDGAFVLLAPTESDAARLAAAIDGSVHLPAWDAAPLSDKAPSAASQAARLAAVAALDAADLPRAVCSAISAVQAVPPADVAARRERVETGRAIDGLHEALVRLGYRAVQRVDGPGTHARYGAITDLWCADRDAPVRLRHSEGLVTSIEPCEPVTLRSTLEVLDAVAVPGCAANPCPDGEGPPEAPADWTLRHERRTLHDVVDDPACVLVMPGVVERGAAIIADIDAEDADRTASGEAVPPRGGWMSAEEWNALTTEASVVTPDAPAVETPMAPHGELAEEPLETDDVVVHLHHGLGIYRGVETVTIDGSGHEALQIEFADGSLAVPAYEADLVWRYGDGADVALAKLGSDGWAAAIASLARDLREAAAAITRARAERATREAPLIAWDHAAIRALRDDWHRPTPDQASALADVEGDMDGTAHAATRTGDGVRPPMDRLLCGDTGFGKTEIIVRAAAATVACGHQAIVAVPTTILAEQHGATFVRRLEAHGMTVRVVTGATPEADAARTLAMLADGEPIVVIGTHALAGEDVLAPRIGLLAIDEEQRFGAAIKLALRAKGPAAHVLATTATPIPRTMMAALVGLRSVSTLRTPPPGRRGVRTEVAKWDAARLRRALRAERRKGGRSFVVVPRIDDIERVEAGLAALTPECTVGVLHGRMDDGKAAARLRAFREGELDVLLATTVIESGIDVPEANLMVVLDAGRFGVGQLHQLRGRVGRADRRGRALLFASCEWIDTVEGATDRLALLSTHDELGAGFDLASRDLAQRGSGDPFGEEQTGHTRTVGVELYARLMRDALDGDDAGPLAASRARLDLPGALIPDDYVPHADVRARLYGRLAKARDAAEAREIADEMADRFGPAPEPAMRFANAAAASARARRLGAIGISAGDDAVALDLEPGAASHFAPLVRGSAIEWKGERIVLRSTKADPERLEALLDALERANEAAPREETAPRDEAA